MYDGKMINLDNESIEKFSVMRTLLAIERADVCLVLIDALEGVTDQKSRDSMLFEWTKKNK